MSIKPVCVPCHRFFRQVKSGFYFIEGMPREGNAPPGTSDPALWRPYKLWSSDKWKCEGCGAEILCGFGHSPISEHYKEDFGDMVRATEASYQVNDC